VHYGDRSSKVESRIVIPVVGGSNPLGHPITPQASFQRILKHSVEQIAHNARGMLGSSDPEFLHQLRVHQRRLRAALRAFRQLLSGKKRKRLIRDLRALSPILGAARDWDVLLARAQVGAKAQSKAATARAEAVDAVRSQKFARMLERAAALEAEPIDQPIEEFAAESLERAHRKLMKRAPGLDWVDSRRRHAVRIRVKRLRYTSEFFAPAFPARASAPYIAALKELQTVLGELNDIAVAKRLVGLDADETLLLRRLGAAWTRFEKRPPFWRAPERRLRRAAR
jgi:triphosphatase